MKNVIGVIITLAMAASASALAVEWRLGEDTQLKVSGAVTFGSGIRTEDPRPENYGSLSGSRVGRSNGLTAANSGGPDLNFEQGKPFTTVLKGFADFDLGHRSFGAFTRLKAWYDYELEKGDRAYGNYPNAFAQNQPLSDNRFAPEAKFSNALFTAAYVYGGIDLGRESRLDGRLGRQFVNWGTAQSITGGVNVINPRDFAAAQRPGALPQETRIPVGMVYANFAAGKQWGVDAFVPYESRHDVIAGCGTYFNVATYAPTGCDMATVTLPPVGVLASPASRTEPALLASGRYVHRAPDVEAEDGGEFGLSLRYALAQLGTELRGYAMNYHSRAFMLRGTNANIGGTFGALNPITGNFSRLTDPNGVKYALLYPEDIHLFGLSFDTRRGQATRIFGELAYRPNQPLSINLADVADAFVARNPNSILNRPASGKNALALPPGANFDAYDRFKVTTGKRFAGALTRAELAGVEAWVKAALGCTSLEHRQAPGGGMLSHNFVQLVGEKESGPRPHTDSRALCTHAAVIYLQPRVPEGKGGTAFYRLQLPDGSLGGNVCPPPHTHLTTALNVKQLPLKAWKQEVEVPNAFNRILLYRADLVHSASSYFGEVDSEKRMTALFFWWANF